MRLTDEKLETMLRSQMWIEPRMDFTQRVLASLPAFAPASQRTAWYERALMAIPAVAFLGLIVQNAGFLGNFAMNYLRDIGFWLGSTTGLPVFAAYPIIVLGILAPVLAGAVASCALSGRCQISRALTP